MESISTCPSRLVRPEDSSDSGAQSQYCHALQRRPTRRRSTCASIWVSRMARHCGGPCGITTSFRQASTHRSTTLWLSTRRWETTGVQSRAARCTRSVPGPTIAEARFVPDRWLTADLSSDEAILAKLPTGPREDRHEGVVRWTFTGPEIDAGDVEEHFRKVAAALGVVEAPVRGDPYR